MITGIPLYPIYLVLSNNFMPYFAIVPQYYMYLCCLIIIYSLLFYLQGAIINVIGIQIQKL